MVYLLYLFITIINFFLVSELQLQNMSGLAEADALAITLEPLGGSESPTLDQMVVMGKV